VATFIDLDVATRAFEDEQVCLVPDEVMNASSATP